MSRHPARAAAGAPLAALAAACLLAPAARAQGGPLASQCGAPVPPPSQGFPLPNLAGDACQQAVDLFGFMAPQLGRVVAGGSPVLGQGGTVGGLGHFSLGLRVTGIEADVPRVGDLRPQLGSARRSAIGTSGRYAGFPVLDAAIGLYGGVPMGITRVGGVDLLLNAAYVPEFERAGVTVRTPGRGLQVGYGARVGLLQESPFVPGVSVAVLRRELPRAEVLGVTGNDTVGVSGTRVRADSWRLVASKRLLILGIAAGVGQDRHDARASIFARVNEPLVSVRVDDLGVSQRFTTWNYFGNVSLLTLPLVRVVAEVGRVQAVDLPATYNDFGGRNPGASRTYGSVGVRVSY